MAWDRNLAFSGSPGGGQGGAGERPERFTAVEEWADLVDADTVQQGADAVRESFT